MKAFRFVLSFLLACFFASCASPSMAPAYKGDAHSRNALRSEAVPAASPVPKPKRSGLATSWGEDRDSRVTYSDFSRGGNSRPYGSGKIFYNNESGAEAMAERSGFKWAARGPVSIANGTVSMGLKNSSGSYLKSYAADGDRFFVGENGDRYQIHLRNLTNDRIEVVVSVDGLDVMDGESASVKKRGYLIRPRASLTIEGFRQSTSKVAAFRFGSVSESYASRKHGDSRNVGVIGVAVWSENGRDPFRPETWKRRSADPFPSSGRFATPP